MLELKQLVGLFDDTDSLIQFMLWPMSKASSKQAHNEGYYFINYTIVKYFIKGCCVNVPCKARLVSHIYSFAYM